MASRSKAAYSERKSPKSTFILTVNPPLLSIIQGKENRLFHRPISSAIGTGGLDFLIAYALLTLCHSLFEVVIYLFVPSCTAVSPVSASALRSNRGPEHEPRGQTPAGE